MLIIRNSQMAEFSKQMWADFIGTASSELIQECNEYLEGLSDDEQRRRASWALNRGRAHGLTQSEILMMFASCTLTYGPAFDRHPWILKMLSHQDLAPDLRWCRLIDSTPANIWAELNLLATDLDWRHIEITAKELSDHGYR
jgi:hypothetical protein